MKVSSLFALICLLFSPPLLGNVDWKLFHEEEGIQLFRAPENQSGIIPFKAVTTLPYTQEEVLKVLTNYKDKKLWSPKLKRVQVHQALNSNAYIFSEYYRTPWPATDREFLLIGEIIFKDRDTLILSAESVENNEYADRKHIQCDVSYLDFIIERTGKNQSRITFEFLGDMKGWMPIWLINIIQKKWPLRFLQSLKERLQNTKTETSKIFKELDRQYRKAEFTKRHFR